MRRDDRTLKFVFHGYLPPSASEANVSEMFGGGKYRTQLIVVNAEGAEVIKTQRDINVPGAYKPPTGDLPGVGNKPTETVAFRGNPSNQGLPNNGDSIGLLNTALIGSVIDLLKSFREVKTPAPAASGMTPEVLIAMINKQSDMQMALMTAMLSRDKGDSKKELLELMTELKALVAPAGTAPNPNNPAEMMGNIVETIKQLRDLSDDINPAKSTAEPMDILAKLAEVVVTEQQNRGRRPALTPKERQQNHPAITQGGTAVPPPRLPIWQQVLRKEGPKLLAQAKAGRDPGLVANVALEYAPEQIQQHLAAFFQLEPDDIMKKMYENIPGLEEYAEWTTGFIQEARIALGYEEEPEEAPTGEGEEGTEVPEAEEGEGDA